MLTSLVVSIALLTNCIEDPEYYLQSFEIAGYDSVSLGDYEGKIYYRYYNEHKIQFVLQILDGTNVIHEVADYDISLFNFSQNDNREEYTRDIDGDGLSEFILNCNGGGQQCCSYIYVYSLRDKPVKRDSVYCETPFVRLIDLDGDEIPEIFCGDNWFKGWKAHPSESAGIRLIWKWDGKRYRLANFKFADYLLNIMQDRWERWYYEIPPPDTLEELRYDPDSEEPDFPPVQLWSKMLMFIYAGQPDKADSLLDDYWPEEIPGKDEFYRDFKWYLERSGHWQQLLESDW